MKVFLLTAIIVVITSIHGVSIDQDLTLTRSQKSSLDKFKKLVDPYLPHEYMKKEIYLIRWLRARDFNEEAAKVMLIKNLEWRKEKNMDNILTQDWKAFDEDYDHISQGFDKQGRPVIETHVGSWDVRAAVLQGKQEELKRLMDIGLEQATSKIRELQSHRKNVTQYYHIYNLDGFNLIQHACPQCIGPILHLLTTYDNHYPGTAHKSVMVNSPVIFEPVLRTVRLAASPLTRDAFFVFGRNKKEWQAFLLKDIAKDQLSRELGGTLIPDLKQ